MNDKQLTAQLALLLPFAKEAPNDSVASLNRDLLEFGILYPSDLDDLWNSEVASVKQQQEKLWSEQTLKEEKILEQSQYPWVHNRVGLIVGALENRHGPYWSLYRARNSEVKFKEVLFEHFAPRHQLRPHGYNWFARYRNLDQAEKFFDDLKLQFTAPRCFGDMFDSARDMRVDFDSSTVAGEVVRQWEEIVASPGKPNLDFSIDPINFMSLLLTVQQQEVAKDPNQLAFYRSVLKEGGIENLQKIVMDQLRIVWQAGRTIGDRVRVCCLTTDVFSPKLWEQFGDQHTGCAIMFRAPMYTRNRFWEAKPVVYNDEAPHFVELSEWVGHVFGRKTLDLVSRIERHNLHKDSSFSIEKEWRLFEFADEGDSSPILWVEVQPSDVLALVGGCNVDLQRFRQLRDLVVSKYPHMQIKKCKPSSARGRFEPEDWN